MLMENKTIKEYLQDMLDFIPIWDRLMKVRDLKTTEDVLELGDFTIKYERYGYYDSNYPISFIAVNYKKDCFFDYDSTSFYNNRFHNSNTKRNLKILMLLLREIEGVLDPRKSGSREECQKFIRFVNKCKQKCLRGYECEYGDSPDECLYD
jgi:hypothetical protein